VQIPINVFSDFSVSGSGTLTLGALAGPATSCTAPSGPFFQCFDGAHDGVTCSGLDPDPACGNVPKSCNPIPHCYFGPPLPIPTPGNTGTTTCVMNVIDTAPTGSANTAANGAVTINLSLRAHVYLTGAVYGATTPCPRCISGLCNAGARAGLSCVV